MPKLLAAWLAQPSQAGQAAASGGLVRRRVQEIYAASDPTHPATHARGANSVKTSWVARLLEEDTTAPNLEGDSLEAVLCDELQALAEMEAMQNVCEDSGQAPWVGRPDQTEGE